MIRKRRRSRLLASVFLLLACILAANASFSNSVRISNDTSKKILSVRVSSDGQRFQPVGPAEGIKPGQSADVTWAFGDQCDWFVKAIYADRSESKAEQFNVCGNNVVVEIH